MVGKLAYHIYRAKAVDPLILFNGVPTPATTSPVNIVWLHALLGSGRNFVSLANTLAGEDSAAKIQAEAKMNKAEYLETPIQGAGPIIPPATAPRVYTSATFDLRNHGESYHTPEMHLEGLAEDLGVFLQDYASTYHLGGTEAPAILPPPPAGGPLPLVLVGHSMGAMAMLHWAWCHHIKIWSNKILYGDKSPTGPNQNVFSNPYYKILGTVSIDMAPAQRPTTFNDTIRMIEFLPQLPLSSVCSHKEAEDWLLTHGPQDVFTQKRIWHIRYHLSNIDFTNPAEPRWRVGLDEIMGGLQCILWEEGGIESMRLARETLRTVNRRRISEHKHIWERPSRMTEFPMFFVFGEKSPYYTRAGVESLIEHFHHPHIRVMKGSDHFLFMNKKAPFTDLLKDFVSHLEEKNGLTGATGKAV